MNKQQIEFLNKCSNCNLMMAVVEYNQVTKVELRICPGCKKTRARFVGEVNRQAIK
jgi:hypothetical protein